MAQNGCLQVPLDPNNSRKKKKICLASAAKSPMHCGARRVSTSPFPRITRSLFDTGPRFYFLRRCYRQSYESICHMRTPEKKSILRPDMQVPVHVMFAVWQCFHLACVDGLWSFDIFIRARFLCSEFLMSLCVCLGWRLVLQGHKIFIVTPFFLPFLFLVKFLLHIFKIW